MSSETYPRSSIEDDFNYGTNVATASVQIRMGKQNKGCVVVLTGILATSANASNVKRYLLTLEIYINVTATDCCYYS